MGKGGKMKQGCFPLKCTNFPSFRFIDVLFTVHACHLFFWNSADVLSFLIMKSENKI